MDPYDWARYTSEMDSALLYNAMVLNEKAESRRCFPEHAYKANQYTNSTSRYAVPDPLLEDVKPFTPEQALEFLSTSNLNPDFNLFTAPSSQRNTVPEVQNTIEERLPKNHTSSCHPSHFETE